MTSGQAVWKRGGGGQLHETTSLYIKHVFSISRVSDASTEAFSFQVVDEWFIGLLLNREKGKLIQWLLDMARVEPGIQPLGYNFTFA